MITNNCLLIVNDPVFCIQVGKNHVSCLADLKKTENKYPNHTQHEPQYTIAC